ncbi:hypothetical protein SAMD00024442_4_67 [Candidatus Symbiothrix dinenymphae]|nr:hypothetical protein SAMD00024442_4_67 [Candidatus Symbiothrix dinenymphae]
MKKLFFIAAVAAFTTGALAQNNEKDVIYIRSVKFATPLLEKWIAEYSKVNPEVKIAVADKTVDAESVDIQLLASDGQTDNQQAFTIGRYAVLPIASKNSTVLSTLQKKKLNNKRIKELFFEKDILDDDYDEDDAKDKYNATIYSVVNASSVANAFANHFGYEPSRLRGKKISGDEIYLINAVQKDQTGVTFNNLSYIYDINSRTLKSNIALLPLDLKREYSEVIAEANLDKVINLLETKTIDLIPVEGIQFVASHTPDAQTNQFLHWVATEGQAYNHQFGFLNADKKALAQH